MQAEALRRRDRLSEAITRERLLSLHGQLKHPHDRYIVTGAIKASPTIVSLSLGGNEWPYHVGRVTAEDLADAIQCHPTLTQLSLYQCGVNDECAFAIARALVHPACRLEDLNLTGSVEMKCYVVRAIGTNGAMAIACALGSNKSLRKLNLENNQIDPKGIGAILCSLKNNTTLRTLNLQGNNVNGMKAQDLEGVLETFQCNTSLVEWHGLPNLPEEEQDEDLNNILRQIAGLIAQHQIARLIQVHALCELDAEMANVLILL